MIKKVFDSYDILLSEYQCNQLNRYYELLVEWNEKINLTAITDYEEVIWKHFLDSALLLKCSVFQQTKRNRILDLGTGAGFPGLVLAILCPECEFYFVDSLKKRIDFLSIVCEELQIENVQLFHGRAEECGRRKDFRNQFDFVISRAVAQLPVLMEYCVPFVKKDGYFVSYKGKKYNDEIKLSENACQKLNIQLEKVEEFRIEDKEERYLLFFKNLSMTDEKYPRKSGKPKKNPL